jgi:hypothetical protein
VSCLDQHGGGECGQGGIREGLGEKSVPHSRACNPSLDASVDPDSEMTRMGAVMKSARALKAPEGRFGLIVGHSIGWLHCLGRGV